MRGDGGRGWPAARQRGALLPPGESQSLISPTFETARRFRQSVDLFRPTPLRFVIITTLLEWPKALERAQYHIRPVA